jgi:predicted DNA-binding transcriptional regulator AlpA
VTNHIVGVAEIADMLGVSRQRVDRILKAHDDFPEPEAQLTAGRIWSRRAIEDWLAAHPERRPGRPRKGA